MLNVSMTRGAPWWASGAKSCHGLPALAAAIVFIVVGLGWWQVFRSPVVSYGAADDIKFFPSRATEGDRIDLCFSGIEWKRLCPGQLVTHFTPFSGPRLDLEVHNIVPPPEAKKLGFKCRKWDVPFLGGNDATGKPLREEGPGFVTGFNASYCTPLDNFYPIYQALPQIPIDVRRKH